MRRIQVMKVLEVEEERTLFAGIDLDTSEAVSFHIKGEEVRHEIAEHIGTDEPTIVEIPDP